MLYSKSAKYLSASTAAETAAAAAHAAAVDANTAQIAASDAVIKSSLASQAAVEASGAAEAAAVALITATTAATEGNASLLKALDDLTSRTSAAEVAQARVLVNEIQTTAVTEIFDFTAAAALKAGDALVEANNLQKAAFAARDVAVQAKIDATNAATVAGEHARAATSQSQDAVAKASKSKIVADKAKDDAEQSSIAATVANRSAVGHHAEAQSTIASLIAVYEQSHQALTTASNAAATAAIHADKATIAEFNATALADLCKTFATQAGLAKTQAAENEKSTKTALEASVVTYEETDDFVWVAATAVCKANNIEQNAKLSATTATNASAGAQLTHTYAHSLSLQVNRALDTAVNVANEVQQCANQANRMLLATGAASKAAEMANCQADISHRAIRSQADTASARASVSDGVAEEAALALILANQLVLVTANDLAESCKLSALEVVHHVCDDNDAITETSSSPNGNNSVLIAQVARTTAEDDCAKAAVNSTQTGRIALRDITLANQTHLAATHASDTFYKSSSVKSQLEGIHSAAINAAEMVSRTACAAATISQAVTKASLDDVLTSADHTVQLFTTVAKETHNALQDAISTNLHATTMHSQAVNAKNAANSAKNAAEIAHTSALHQYCMAACNAEYANQQVHSSSAAATSASNNAVCAKEMSSVAKLAESKCDTANTKASVDITTTAASQAAAKAIAAEKTADLIVIADKAENFARSTSTSAANDYIDATYLSSAAKQAIYAESVIITIVRNVTDAHEKTLEAASSATKATVIATNVAQDAQTANRLASGANTSAKRIHADVTLTYTTSSNALSLATNAHALATTTSAAATESAMLAQSTASELRLRATKAAKAASVAQELKEQLTNAAISAKILEKLTKVRADEAKLAASLTYVDLGNLKDYAIGCTGACTVAAGGTVYGHVMAIGALSLGAGSRILPGNSMNCGDSIEVQSSIRQMYHHLLSVDSVELPTLPKTLLAGVYGVKGARNIASPLTLEGSLTDVWIIQCTGALNVANNINLVGGALASNVYWVVGGAFNTAASTNFYGNVISYGACGIGANSNLFGTMYSVEGACTVGENAKCGIY